VNKRATETQQKEQKEDKFSHAKLLVNEIKRKQHQIEEFSAEHPNLGDPQ
jgi:hypothetical protein